MKISVVVPAFDAADTIREQLDALAGQDWRGPLEVVVSDNGSTDGTVSVVESYAGRFPRLRIVDSSERRGPAHARNVGASVATGDHLLFCDADDVVGDRWLGAMATALEQHPFVAARVDHHQLNPVWTRAIYGEPQRDELLAPPAFLPFALGGTFGVRRDLHDAVGGFDEALRTGEDADYCYRIQLHGYPIQLVTDAVVHRRARQDYGEIFHQHRGYGGAWAALFRGYAPYGLRPASRLRTVLGWAALIPRLPLSLGTRERRAAWVAQLGWKVGYLEDSVRGRLRRPTVDR